MDGKVAVVSGASSGSGVGITRRFVQEGATVVMLARARQRLEEVAAEFGPSVVPIPTDVGDPDSVRAAFEEVGRRFGQLHVLVNHAAVYRPCAVELLDDDDITRQMATNFFGPVYASRAAVPLLRAAGGGDIVNTSSESTLHPFPMLSMYVASKAALEAFGKVLAQEVRDDDIRVTTVVQGTAAGAGGGATDFAWDPTHAAAAHALWTERGLLGEVLGRYSGQSVDDIGDVHVFIVTRPREQRLDTVHVRSFCRPVGGRRSAVGGRRSAVGGRRSAVGGRRSAAVSLGGPA
jgi:NAD(P)-dependent dehydrogenase (short-subunit alcohol dehydrogenase family)